MGDTLKGALFVWFILCRVYISNTPKGMNCTKLYANKQWYKTRPGFEGYLYKTNIFLKAN